MATYIKVNPKVAQYLGLTEKRYQFEDGAYMLWQGDIIAFGPMVDKADILRRIGGVEMTHDQALAEQKKLTCTPLPVPAEIRFQTEGQSDAETEVEPDNAEQL